MRRQKCDYCKHCVKDEDGGLVCAKNKWWGVDPEDEEEDFYDPCYDQCEEFEEKKGGKFKISVCEQQRLGPHTAYTKFRKESAT